MNIGEPLREIIVEPLELPAPLRREALPEPDYAPVAVPNPKRAPEEEPANV